MNPLLTQFLWQIDEAYLSELQFKLRAARTKTFADNIPKEVQANIKMSGLTKSWNDYLTKTYSTSANVLVLPVQGEMSRSGYWGFGNDFFVRQLKSAATDSDYKGAVMQVHTPGGTADSTPGFAQAVAEFKKVKPIITQTAYCASAGVYVASQSTEILMEDQAASSFGSIGTLLIYENYMDHLKQQGISIEIMRATSSQDKARVNWIETLSGESRAELQAMLDACQKEFAGAVKRGRAGKLTSNEALTGKMYGVNEAIKLGLVDGKGSLADAVNRVLELAN